MVKKNRYIITMKCLDLQEGRNNTSIAKSSNLPNIIPSVKIHLEISGKLEKLLLGPIIEPNPGPTFDIEVAAPEIEVTKSKPLKDKNAVIKKNITK